MPDIGDFKDVAVIEVLVKPGDTIKVEQTLITVETDKASMEIPSSQAGVVKELKVKVGDKVPRHRWSHLIEGAAGAAAAPAPAAAAAAPAPAARACRAAIAARQRRRRASPTAALPPHEPDRAAGQPAACVAVGAQASRASSACRWPR